MRNFEEDSGLEGRVRSAKRKGGKKSTSRRMRASDLYKIVPQRFDVPTTPATITAIDGREVEMHDPMGTVVNYLNKVEQVKSRHELTRDRDYIQVPYEGTYVQFPRRG